MSSPSRTGQGVRMVRRGGQTLHPTEGDGACGEAQIEREARRSRCGKTGGGRNAKVDR